jgi:CBS domain-containing protein
MNIGQRCNRNVVTIGKSDPVLEAARRMRDEHVGDLVVVEERDGRRMPVGMLTDRDIVVGLVAQDVSHLAELDVGDILTRDIVTATADEDIETVLGRMQRQGIRRMPVVDEAGGLMGIFTVDDLLELLSEDMVTVIKLIGRERRQEIAQRT